MSKPFSQACENNKDPILDCLRPLYPAGARVLEIGSLTAQHVCHFAAQMLEVQWQPSETPGNLATLQDGLADCTLPNIAAPLVLDVTQESWPVDRVDGVFSANTLHIMPLAAVEDFFRGVGRVLRPGGLLCVYGPFNYQGQFTSASNARFDAWLKERDARSGIRDAEQIDAWAAAQGLDLVADNAMPANNRVRVWQRRGRDETA